MQNALTLALWLLSAAGPDPLPPPSPAAVTWPGTPVAATELWAEAEASARRGRSDALGRLYRALDFVQAYPGPQLRKEGRAALARIARARKAPFAAAHAAYWLGEPAAASVAMIGPFPGGEADYAPELPGHALGPVKTDHYTLRWQPVDGSDGGFDLSPWSLPAGDTVAYLTFAITADRAQDAVLWLGTEGSLRVTHNHQRLAETELARGGLDGLRLPVRLQAGPNLFLVRVGWQGSRCRLHIRLSDPKGRPLRPKACDPGCLRQAFARRYPPVPRSRAKGAQPIDRARARAQRRRATAEDKALFAQLYFDLGRAEVEDPPSEGERALRAAIRMAPGVPRYRLQLARQLLARDPSQARRLLEEALVSDPDFSPARLELARLAEAEGQDLGAMALLDHIVRDDPGCYAARLARARLGVHQLGEGARALRGLPPGPRGALLAAQVRQGARDLRGAAELAAETLRRDPSDGEALGLLSGLYVHLDPLEAQRLISDSPPLAPSLAYGLWRVRVMASLLEDPEGAAVQLQRLGQRFAFSPEVPALAAALKLWQGAPALADIDRSLKLSPNQAGLRLRRRALSAEQLDLRDRFRVDPQDARGFAKLKTEADFGGAMLVDNTALRLNADGSYTRYRQSILRADKPLRLGQDALLTFQGSREWLQVLAVQRVRANGEAEKLKHWTVGEQELSRHNRMYSGLDTLVAEIGTLQPGELLNVEYELSGEAAHELGGFFGDIQLPKAGSRFPRRDWSYTLIAPRKLHLSHTESGLPPPQEKLHDGQRELRWFMQELAPLTPEVNGPSLLELSPVLSLSSYQRWADLGRWYGPRYARELPLNASLKAQVRRWLAPSDAQSSREFTPRWRLPKRTSNPPKSSTPKRNPPERSALALPPQACKAEAPSCGPTLAQRAGCDAGATCKPSFNPGGAPAGSCAPGAACAPAVPLQAAAPGSCRPGTSGEECKSGFGTDDSGVATLDATCKPALKGAPDCDTGPARGALPAGMDRAEVTRIVQRLYAQVVKHTRYVGVELGAHGWIPSSANQVYAQGHGDCKDKSTLLVALLREAGVPAALTLVRTVDRGVLPTEHPTMWAFNHAIAYVPALDLFLDPTAEFNGSTELPALDQGAMALVVYPDGAVERRNLPVADAPDNLNRSDYQVYLSREGGVRLKGTERFRGVQAAQLRQRLQEEQGRRKLLEQQLSAVLPGAKLTALKLSELHKLEAPVAYDYSFQAPDYGQHSQDSLTIPVSFFRHQVARGYASLAHRDSPLVLTHAWRTQNRLRYVLPEGAKLRSLPKGVKIDSKHISLTQEITRVDGGFVVDDIVTLKHRRVPAADYPAFRQACLQIDRAMARKVVITW